MEKIIKILKDNVDLSKSEYSKYKVISLFEFKDELVIGANIENGSYSLSMCAERVALYTSLMKRKDLSLVKNIYVYSPSDIFPLPCGACLQVLSEFLDPNTPINTINGKEEVVSKKLKDLFPFPFKKEDN